MNAATAALVDRAVAAAPPVTPEVLARLVLLLPPVIHVAEFGHPPAGPSTPPPPPRPKHRAA